MKFIDFLKCVCEETSSGDIATVDQKFPSDCHNDCKQNRQMIRNRFLKRLQQHDCRQIKNPLS